MLRDKKNVEIINDVTCSTMYMIWMTEDILI